MYKNEYLEECLKNEKGNKHLLRGYIYTQNNEYNELVIDNLGFISNNIDELKELKNELIKANIKRVCINRIKFRINE